MICRMLFPVLSLRRLLACSLAVALLWTAAPAWSGIHVYEFPDTETEQRFRELTHELRCPKCQNQNINDSDAPLARDIKDRVHGLLLEGKSKDEITDFMIERYGDFVTYRPRLSLGTFLLWTVPAAAALLAFIALVWVARSRQTPAERAAHPDADEPAASADPADGEAGTDRNTVPVDHRRIDDLLRKYSDATEQKP